MQPRTKPRKQRHLARWIGVRPYHLILWGGFIFLMSALKRPRHPIERRGLFTSQSSLLGADLDRLHAGLGFGAGLVHAVADHGRRGGRRLLVDDGAFLGRGIADDIESGGLSIGAGNGEGGNRARDQELLHGVSSSDI